MEKFLVTGHYKATESESCRQFRLSLPIAKHYEPHIVKKGEDQLYPLDIINTCPGYARKKHEETLHEGKPKQYKCEKCTKSFSNSNALSYHQAKHDNEVTRDTCDLCGSQFSSDGTLRHKQLVHGEMPAEPEYVCLECGIKFSRKDNLNRHRKENHYDTSKANYDFVEDLDTLTSVSKDSKESRICSATTVGRIVRLKLKITLNVITVKRSIPGKIISLDILNLHTKTNFWIIVLFSPPLYQIKGVFLRKYMYVESI